MKRKTFAKKNLIYIFVCLLINFGVYSQNTLLVSVKPASFKACMGDTIIFTAPDNLTNYSFQVRVSANGNIITSNSSTLSIFGLNFNKDIYLQVNASATASDGSTLEYTDFYGIATGPGLNLGNDTTVCLGSSITLKNLDSLGIDTYTYQWSNGSTSPTITTSLAGKYFLTMTSSNTSKCKSTRSITVNNFPAFIVDAGGDVVRCFNQPLQLNATLVSSSSRNFSYLWSPFSDISDPTIQNPVVTPSFATNYKVVVTDENGCKDSSFANVKINPALTTSILNGDSLLLCKFVYANLSSSVSGGTSGYTYAWSPSKGLTNSAISNPSVQAISINGINYKLTVTDANNCTATDSIQIKRNNLQLNFTPNVDTSNLCTSQVLTLNVRALNASQPRFIWTTSGVNLTKLSETSYQTPKLSTSTKVLVTLFDSSNTCADKDSVFLKVNGLPPVNLNLRTLNACIKSSITGIAATTVSGLKYLWSSSNPLNTISNIGVFNPSFYLVSTLTSQFVVTVTSTLTGCSNKDSVRVIPKQSTAFKINAADVYILTPATFSTNAPLGGSMIWKTTNEIGLQTISGYSAQFTFDSVKTYKVNAIFTNASTCLSYDTLTFTTKRYSSKIIYIPNVFSPAATDSRNSAFKIFAENADINTTVFALSIYSQSGNEVFSSTSFETMKNIGWTGENSFPGVYTYVVKGEFSDGTPYTQTGTVRLLQ
jgi:hypothetical protein